MDERKGKVEVMARKRTMGIYMDTFCYDSDIELRRTTPPISILLHFRSAPI